MNTNQRPIMVLGTSSGSGKSLFTAAICGSLKRHGEFPVPFKGQNMSNNAWIDENGGEMAYSQAFQAWAAGIDPICSMNPVLLKPQGNCKSEIIHLGESVGIAKAQNYYKDYFSSGWNAITKGLETLKKTYPYSRLVLEGAGSPVEINLQHRDLTNLKLAKYLNANCILVADIERGGVFAQLIGTLELLKPYERKLIKGIVINKFRGDLSLFDSGREWLENRTKIPVLGTMPWLQELFPAEDSLDLIERKYKKKSNTDIEISVIKLPHLSNYSDIEPLEAEESIKVNWIHPGKSLGSPDAVIIPGSKQTLQDLEVLKSSGMGNTLNEYAKEGGYIFGICGGLQMLGKNLEDPLGLERNGTLGSQSESEGLGLLPIKTTFEKQKFLRQRTLIANWPENSNISGFELHHGVSKLIPSEQEIKDIFTETNLGWILNLKGAGSIAGTYIHGIFENGKWRRLWINEIRKRKKLKPLELTNLHFRTERQRLINQLVDAFDVHIDLKKIL